MLLGEILRIPDRPFAGEIGSVISVCDRLHLCPIMPFVPIVLTRSRREEGAYQMIVRPRRPKQIEISRYAAHPSLTILHEIGHLPDHMALNRIGYGFGSETDPAFDAPNDLWRRSHSISRLSSIITRNRRYVAVAALRGLQYQLSARECWARTYVQWVASRSQNTEVFQEFERVKQEGVIFGGEWCSLFWEDDNFDDIMEGIDRLFRKADLL